MLNELNSFSELAKIKSKKIIAVAAAEDVFALDAIKMVTEEGLAAAILIGCKDEIISISKEINFNLRDVLIIDVPDKSLACKEAIALIRSGKAQILMKGLVNSSIYLRAILNKETGLAKSKLVTQLAFIESPFYHKIFAITDAGINISPNKDDKEKMLVQSVEVLHKLNINCPKVAIIAAVENVSPSIQATVDASEISSKDFDDCIVEGPLSIDLAFNEVSCLHKGLSTRVGGDVDLIVLPDINSANIFYKTVMKLGNALSASILTGTSAPIVFTSRSDTSRTKYFSIVCAIAQCKD